MSPLPPKADTRQHKRHVRFGSLGDICNAASDVRFAPNGDRESGHRHKVMSALPPKADMCGAPAHVCFGPEADIAHSMMDIHALRKSVGVDWSPKSSNPTGLPIIFSSDPLRSLQSEGIERQHA